MLGLEPSKRRLVLVYLEKNFENKQKQLVRVILIVEVFYKFFFFLIHILENLCTKFLKIPVKELIFSKVTKNSYRIW